MGRHLSPKNRAKVDEMVLKLYEGNSVPEMAHLISYALGVTVSEKMIRASKDRQDLTIRRATTFTRDQEEEIAAIIKRTHKRKSDKEIAKIVTAQLQRDVSIWVIQARRAHMGLKTSRQLKKPKPPQKRQEKPTPLGNKGLGVEGEQRTVEQIDPGLKEQALSNHINRILCGKWW